MEQVKTEISTTAIPGRAILALKQYTDYLASMKRVMPKREDIAVFCQPTTVTSEIANPFTYLLMGSGPSWGYVGAIPPGVVLKAQPALGATISMANYGLTDMTFLKGARVEVFMDAICVATASLLVRVAEIADSTKGIRESLAHSISSSIPAKQFEWTQPAEVLEQPAKEPRWSTASSLLKHATGWAGDDLSERLNEVYKVRSKASF